MKYMVRDLNHFIMFFTILFLIICVLQVFEVIIQAESEEGMQFIVGNEIYTTPSTMKFDSITIASSYIIFNSTGFFVFSNHPINISLLYLNPNIQGARNGEKIVDFNVTAVHARVLIVLSGFPIGDLFIINSDAYISSFSIIKYFGCLTVHTIINGTNHFTIIKMYKNENLGSILFHRIALKS